MLITVNTLTSAWQQTCVASQAIAHCTSHAYDHIAVNPLPLLAEAVEQAIVPFQPKQAFHCLNGKMRVPFTKGTGVEYKVEEHMLPHEVRPYLERKMPCEFGVASFDDLQEGLYAKENGLDFDGRPWVATDIGWVKSGEGCTIVFVPKGKKVNHRNAKLLSKLLKTTDPGKFVKYQKRTCAMYRFHTWGAENWYRNDLLSYRANGRNWRIRYNSQVMQDEHTPAKDFKVEGIGYVSADWAFLNLGPNPDRPQKYDADGNEVNNWKIGDGARLTFLCSQFMVKGHVVVWNLTSVDATFWDAKTQIACEDEVFVGFMGNLHAGRMRLNIQPIVNFGLQEAAVKFGVMAMQDMREAMGTNDGVLRQISMMFANRINDGDDIQINKWRLMSALQAGFDPQTEPFIRRDLYRAYRKDLLDFENGRVPVPEEFGIRAYYIIDPWCVAGNGVMYLNRKRLVGNCIYNSRLENGERVGAYRDPQTPPEYRDVTNVGPASGLDLLDPNLVAVSPDIAMRFAEVQGGGDYDDCGNLLRGWLMEFFFNHKPNYPAFVPDMASLKAKVTRWVDTNIFAQADGLDKPVWNEKELTKMITAAMNADAGVGMIVNWLMVCVALSFYKQHNLLDLKAQICMYEFGYLPMDEIAVVQLLEDCEWYENIFVPFDEKDVAYDLEGAIDGLVMNGAKGETDYNSLGERIRKFWKACRVVPAWALEGGYQNAGRVPASCRQRIPSVVFDPISIAFDKLKRARVQLDEYVNAKQSLNLEPAPFAITTYPCADFLKDKWKEGKRVRKGMVTAAKELWREDTEKLRGNELDGKEAYKAFSDVCAKHYNKLTAQPEDIQFQFIAELERRTRSQAPYAVPKTWWEGHPLEGRPCPIFDGYQNNPDFFPIRRKLWAKEGLLNPLHWVPFYEEFHKLYTHTVDVVVEEGKVKLTADVPALDKEGVPIVRNGRPIFHGRKDKIIGFDLDMPNGEYSLEFGTVHLDS